MKEDYTVLAYMIEGRGHFEPKYYQEGNKISNNSNNQKPYGSVEPESLIFFGDSGDLTIWIKDEMIRFFVDLRHTDPGTRSMA